MAFLLSCMLKQESQKAKRSLELLCIPGFLLMVDDELPVIKKVCLMYMPGMKGQLRYVVDMARLAAVRCR